MKGQVITSTLEYTQQSVLCILQNEPSDLASRKAEKWGC